MRRATATRKSKETNITVTVNLDGSGKTSVKTGLPFLDHMLTLLGTHGLLDLTVKASGDLEVDRHHTNEDIGIVVGQALDRALGDRRGITRFGVAYVPMDEALARVVLDISGRPKLVLRDARPARAARVVEHRLLLGRCGAPAGVAGAQRQAHAPRRRPLGLRFPPHLRGGLQGVGARA